MKKLILILTLAFVSITHAQQLIDLTPGGFNVDEGLPPAFFELQEQIFFDEAAHGFFDLPEGQFYFDGWVSMFGELDGGTYFFTDLFGRDTPSASIWWDFRHTTWTLTMIDVWGRKSDGTAWEHIYAVRPNKARKSQPELVTVDGMTFIQGISFYGGTGRQRPGVKQQPILLKNISQYFYNMKQGK
jgi:hypothetical protein